MASIRTKRLSNGKAAYLVRFRVADGKERSKQFSRRRDAENFAHLIEVDRAQSSFVDPRPGKITVAEWWERWWPTVTNLRPISRVRDECSFRVHVLPTFGSLPLARVDRTSLREWVARLSDPVDGPGLAPASVVKAVQVFNKVMRAAFEDRLIMANPVERLPVPRIEREEMRFLTPEELARLANTIDSRYRAFRIRGLRIGELFALRWQHVDMLRRQVKVTETLTELPALSFGPPKTRASLRTITLPGFVTDELSRVPTSPPDPSDCLTFTNSLLHEVSTRGPSSVLESQRELADLTARRANARTSGLSRLGRRSGRGRGSGHDFRLDEEGQQRHGLSEVHQCHSPRKALTSRAFGRFGPREHQPIRTDTSRHQTDDLL